MMRMPLQAVMQHVSTWSLHIRALRKGAPCINQVVRNRIKGPRTFPQSRGLAA